MPFDKVLAATVESLELQVRSTEPNYRILCYSPARNLQMNYGWGTLMVDPAVTCDPSRIHGT